MNATTELLDNYKAACGIKQDKEAADRLGITKQAVCSWRAGVRHPEADSIAKMATMTGKKVEHWLARIEAERARSPESRKVWLRLAAQAAVIALVALPYAAHAAEQWAVSTAHQMYIM